MSENSLRTILILSTGAFFILAAMIYSFFLKPTYAEIKDLQGKLESLRANYNTYSNLAEQFNEILNQRDPDEVKKDIEKIALMVPVSENVSYVYNQIIGIMKLADIVPEGVSISRLKPKEARDIKKPLGMFEIRFSFDGRYEDLKNLLFYLETNMMIIEPKNLSIKGKGDKLNFSLVLESFYQP